MTIQPSYPTAKLVNIIGNLLLFSLALLLHPAPLCALVSIMSPLYRLPTSLLQRPPRVLIDNLERHAEIHVLLLTWRAAPLTHVGDGLAVPVFQKGDGECERGWEVGG